jgi:hypothetical protein
LLAELRARIETADAREAERLQRRVEQIESAGQEDLPGILHYYRTLDEIRELNELMARYGIAREELRQAGIEPPPRSGRGPDVMEIAYNLENFTTIYEPMVAPELREEYRQDVGKYLVALTARRTDEDLLREKARILAELREREAAATDRERQWIAGRIERLEASDDLDYVRRRMQFGTLRYMDQLVEKYEIPRDELREAGVSTRGPGGGRRRRR